ncbi:NADH dehydrogenase [ubiquinone] 1 beta subcomplex subunit 8, mitochondrial [Alligator mississippiensis]|uniref:NADH dehydrogenase [ubiquinone] 1 beta subcomplex subunit 8, mitochondrial n=1 Tax=Alligator mississippiensis TaxID=8496 RepID=A0A151MKS9_ALLMI|nr:NADH dehydrogenase [ubiquinone] 1 beta subcomplex subunit 8, mitochondrial [Alligator mississippiensis]KYO25127.1 NADH dehydrogenase [ubiquinone] 1 beta subcomplex subunit 8, mitochondrial [Alligator mississippiensis]
MAVLGVRGALWLRAVARLRAPTGVRAASGLPKELLPGPYPRTPEERLAAAKKYNMHPADYEPYPDDGLGCGDYPKLPNRSQEERDPWYPWDDPFHRRNWGEPMHWDFDMFIRPRIDTTATMIPWKTMCIWFFGALGFMAFMLWVGAKYPSYMPAGPKQYPYNNLYLERGGDPNKECPVVKNYEI